MPKFDTTLCPSCNQGLKGAEAPWTSSSRAGGTRSPLTSRVFSPTNLYLPLNGVIFGAC